MALFDQTTCEFIGTGRAKVSLQIYHASFDMRPSGASSG